MRNNNLKKVLVLALLFTASSAFAAATKPGAPTNVAAVAGSIINGNNTATPNVSVAFVQPANNGGAIITSYTVSCSPACTPVSGPSSPIKVTGLAAGTSYTFTVTATNSVGTGPASLASNSAPNCDGALPSYGYMGDFEVWSYKTQGGQGSFCDPAAGCDGYIGVPMYTCSNQTGDVIYSYVLTGPAHDNALVNLIYYQKQAGKMVSYWYSNTTVQGDRRIIGGSHPVQ